ncbi:MAG TPA: hypothetical protein VJ044_08250 [Candidatus Hodarchaeales archaeon]|nr:hypothetical protein [Candidatus Hodarchaeales archaeon]
MDIIIERLAGLVGAFFVLSVVVEKIADFWKLWKAEIRVKEVNKADEKNREKRILSRNITVGIVLALFLKADAVQILVSGEPSEVVGWERVLFFNQESVYELSDTNFQYYKDLSCNSTGGRSWIAWLFACVGILTTGVSLSFGSKFWHDLLGIIYEVKRSKEDVTDKKAAAGKKSHPT